MDWLSAAAAAASSAATAAAAAASAAASAVGERIEDERAGFLAEFERCSASAAASRRGGAAASSGTSTAGAHVSRVRTVGLSLLNPLADQDCLSAVARKGVGAQQGAVMLPWEAAGLSPDVRARMRALSQDRAAFLHPPAGLDQLEPPFVFALDSALDVVMEALSVDKHLEKQRHALVPKEVSEEVFFFNYFAHLHVIATGAVPAVLPRNFSGLGGEAAGRSDAESSAVVVSHSSGSEATEVAAPESPSNPSPTVSPRSPVGAPSASVHVDAEFDAISLELDALSSEVAPAAIPGLKTGTLSVPASALGHANWEVGDAQGRGPAGGTADGGAATVVGVAAEDADEEAEWEAELKAALEE